MLRLKRTSTREKMRYIKDLSCYQKLLVVQLKKDGRSNGYIRQRFGISTKTINQIIEEHESDNA